MWRFGELLDMVMAAADEAGWSGYGSRDRGL
jgi:hypothetical protein